MKKLIFVLITIVAVVLMILTLSACDEDTYKIAWVDENGSVLQIDEKVASGTMPQYLGSIPEKADDANYIYVFEGWSTEVVEATEGMVYVAKFLSLDRRDYCNITWKNYDDSIIRLDKGIKKGVIPEYVGDEPTRPDDENFVYIFEGWTPEIVEATEDATYTAEYKKLEKSNCYTITWKNYDGNILLVDSLVEKGTIPEYKGEPPTRGSDEVFAYAFRGWTPEIVEATEDATYTADYQKVDKYYTVTWKNEDGSVLKVDKRVLYGALPQYTGPAPTKKSNEIYDYMFMGWSPAVKRVTCNATYTASFTGIKKKYTVTWIDTGVYNPSVQRYETVLYTEKVEAGRTPRYRGPEPKKPDNANWGYKYIFDGWDPIPDRLTKDMTFKTKYERAYDVSWYNWSTGPELIKTERRKMEEVENENGYKHKVIPDYIEFDGPTPTIPEDEGYIYEFKDWYQCDSPWDGTNRRMMDREFIATYGCESKDDRYEKYPDFDYEEGTRSYYLPTIRISRYNGGFYPEFYIPAWLEGRIVEEFTISENNLSQGGALKGAFEDNKIIQTVYLGNNLRYTNGRYAFRGCSNLHTIHFGKNMLDIEQEMFAECTSLRRVDIPAPIKKICWGAFEGCTNLMSVTFPDTLETIENIAFSGCESLTSITIPDGVKYIDGFDGCIRLRTVNLGTGVTGIGSSCFNGDTALRNINLEQSNVENIWDYAFNECTSLTRANFPVTLKTIGKRAFNKCTNLRYVDFVDLEPRLTHIDEFAFNECKELGALSIPGSVIRIQKGIVNHCDSLTFLEVSGINNKYESKRNMIIDKEEGMIVAGCNGSGEIPTDSNITRIGPYAFTGSKYFSLNKALMIPDNIKKIGEWAFGGCTGLPHSRHAGHGYNHSDHCKMAVRLPGDCLLEMSVFSMDYNLEPGEDKHFCVYIDRDVVDYLNNNGNPYEFPKCHTQGHVTYHYRCECIHPHDFVVGSIQGTAYMYWHGNYKPWTRQECFPDIEDYDNHTIITWG